jgi:hypothetical protein
VLSVNSAKVLVGLEKTLQSLHSFRMTTLATT